MRISALELCVVTRVPVDVVIGFDGVPSASLPGCATITAQHDCTRRKSSTSSCDLQLAPAPRIRIKGQLYVVTRTRFSCFAQNIGNLFLHFRILNLRTNCFWRLGLGTSLRASSFKNMRHFAISRNAATRIHNSHIYRCHQHVWVMKM